jgi:hypothetical protein
MGMYLRKTKKIGILNINMSKSGIGWSVGPRGMRIGHGPRGTYVRGGRGPIRYQKTLKSSGSTSRTRTTSSRATSVASTPAVKAPPTKSRARLFLGIAVGCLVIGTTKSLSAFLLIGIALLVASAVLAVREHHTAERAAHDVLETQPATEPIPSRGVAPTDIVTAPQMPGSVTTILEAAVTDITAWNSSSDDHPIHIDGAHLIVGDDNIFEIKGTCVQGAPMYVRGDATRTRWDATPDPATGHIQILATGIDPPNRRCAMTLTDTNAIQHVALLTRLGAT